MAFGIFFVMKPEVIAMFFGTVLAIVIIIDGILKLQYGIEFYHMEAKKWWIEAIAAALMVVMGIIALLNPFGSSVALMIFIGVVLMIEGASDLISIIRISGIIKRLKGFFIKISACIIRRSNSLIYCQKQEISASDIINQRES